MEDFENGWEYVRAMISDDGINFVALSGNPEAIERFKKQVFASIDYWQDECEKMRNRNRLDVIAKAALLAIVFEIVYRLVF